MSDVVDGREYDWMGKGSCTLLRGIAPNASDVIWRGMLAFE